MGSYKKAGRHLRAKVPTDCISEIALQRLSLFRSWASRAAVPNCPWVRGFAHRYMALSRTRSSPEPCRGDGHVWSCNISCCHTMFHSEHYVLTRAGAFQFLPISSMLTIEVHASNTTIRQKERSGYYTPLLQIFNLWITFYFTKARERRYSSCRA